MDAKADPFPYTPPGDMDPIERYLIDAMVADMKARPPRLVFVQTYPPKAIANPRFDFITCLSRDPEFAHIWSHYHYLGDALRHQVFKRKD